MDSPILIESLSLTLQSLITHPYPHVANPASCKKRASVALVLRVRPSQKHPPPPPSTSSPPSPLTISQFFAQPWVQHGSPECLFIKRAARVGDRWTSHVALPGGKRDPEDADDRATAIRETSEEIRLDLTDAGKVVSVGNLPERVVSTNLGRVPIMVLCPFVFLYMTPGREEMEMQPAEVASVHWVPLRVLLSPASRTFEYVDVSDRFTRGGGMVTKAITRTLLGRMRFSAIRLTPSESIYCTSTAEFFPFPTTITEPTTSLLQKTKKWLLGTKEGPPENTKPLLLWGLTLGILADFLDQLPPHNSVKLWTYPTFTTWDAQLIIHVLTAGLRKRNQALLEVTNCTAIDSETEAVSIERKGGNEHAVGVKLEGYYDLMRRGVGITLFGRVTACFAVLWYVLKWHRQRQWA